MFGSGDVTSSSSAVVVETPKSTEPEVEDGFVSRQRTKYVNQAERLRQEAAEMEIALREEARAKGLPEEMVNKLIPPPRMPTSTQSVSTETSSDVALNVDATISKLLPEAELRSKLGYLNTGTVIKNDLNEFILIYIDLYFRRLI